MRKFATTMLAAGFCFTPWVYGDFGAASLLDSTGTQVPLPTASGSPMLDGFQSQFLTTWRSLPIPSYEGRLWGEKILQGELSQAAHLWTAIQTQLPEEALRAAKVARLYVLWNLNLPQTFTDAWIESLRHPAIQTSPLIIAFEQQIAPSLDQWLVEKAPWLSEEQRLFVKTMPLNISMARTTLRAYAQLRSGEQVQETLKALPANHRLKLWLARTAIVALARKKQIAQVGRILKTEVEPAIAAKNDPAELSAHYLHLGRLLYQAGSLDAAEQFYLKIPSGSPAFLAAREELAWVWLRQGNYQRLRGDLKTLGQPVYEGKFLPESYVVHAIASLKLCFYDEVEKTIERFIQNSRGWAKEITAATTEAIPPRPRDADFFTELAEKALNAKREEFSRLETLAQESITATLPAVGPQSHWLKAKDKLISDIENSSKWRAAEYRRQWNVSKKSLEEAIRKLRFVRVEFLSQVRWLTKTKETGPKIVTLDNKPASAKLDTEPGSLSFRYDEVYWPDEMFRLRSLAQAQCLERIKQ